MLDKSPKAGIFIVAESFSVDANIIYRRWICAGSRREAFADIQQILLSDEGHVRAVPGS